MFVTALGLLAAIAWGFGDFLGASAAKRLGPIGSAFYINVLGTIIMGALYPLLPHIAQVTRQGMWLSIAGGAVISCAMALLYIGFKLGPVSIVSPVSSAYPVVMSVLALTLLHATLTGRQLLAIGMVVLGVMAAAGLFTAKKSERRLSTGPLLAIGSVVVYGIGFSVMAQAVTHTGWALASLLQCMGGTAVFAVLLPLLGGRERPLRIWKRAVTSPVLIGSTIGGIGGMVALNIAFTHEHAAGAIAGSLSSCYPVFTILLALRHFKEEIRPIPLSGALLTITGVVLLSLH